MKITTHSKPSAESTRVAYILKGAPIGHILCTACDGYGDADPDDYDGRPISRICFHCEGDGHILDEEFEA